jgi:hypothetical protein
MRVRVSCLPFTAERDKLSCHYISALCTKDNNLLDFVLLFHQVNAIYIHIKKKVPDLGILGFCYTLEHTLLLDPSYDTTITSEQGSYLDQLHGCSLFSRPDLIFHVHVTI